MPKLYSSKSLKQTLVIVESPAKCKKIEDYLGAGYKCLASYGHIRELSSLNDIDIENGFKPNYRLSDNAIKKKQIELLKKEIKQSNEVIIATDDDREGEAIGYSIIETFNLPLTTKRIVFHEITKSAILNAIQNPTTINMNLVHSQQARSILDVLVGFKISPMLWKFITKKNKNALSAGRCQTPALKLIYENYKDIKASEEKKIYKTTGIFTNLNLEFELNKHYENDNEVIDFLENTIEHKHIFTRSEPSITKKNPPQPLTTSRLQQIASNNLKYSPKETMSVCQILYEAGYITYMRTDSKYYSKEFIETTKKYIFEQYGDNKYINEKIDELELNRKTDKSKQGLAQEAHESIRPTNISLYELPKTMETKERSLYKLIWTITLESCMSPAIYNTLTACISGYNNTKFTRNSEQQIFAGWKAVKNSHKIDDCNDDNFNADNCNAEINDNDNVNKSNNEYNYLLNIKLDSEIKNKKTMSKMAFSGLKSHYTEAKLVQLLEEKGIGRPSTFSSIINKIQERGYAKREDIKGKEVVCTDYELEDDEISEIENKRLIGNEKSKLVIQPLGIIVIEFLLKHFSLLFEYNYTSQMEETLDNIANGITEWVLLCDNCNKQLDLLIDGLKDETKIECKIDDQNTYLVGKYGPVIKYTEKIDGKEEVKFKPIKKDIEVNICDLKSGSVNLENIIDESIKTKSSYILGKHEGNDIVVKRGKYGLYVKCGEITKPLKDFEDESIENITLHDVMPFLKEGSNILREVTKEISIRKGPKGDYIFYKSSKMRKPKFFDIKSFYGEKYCDYKICNSDILKSWIKEKYGI